MLELSPPRATSPLGRQNPEPTNYVTGNRTRRDDRRWMMDDGQNPESGRQKNNSSFIPHPSSLILLLFMFCALFLTACARQDRVFKESRFVMDTLCTITVVSPSEKQAGKAIGAGFDSIEILEQRLSFFSSDSEVTAINNAAGSSPVMVSKETFGLIQKAIEVADITYGAFDPSVAPLTELWDFSGQDPEHPVVPGEREIKLALRSVGYKKIKADPSASEVLLEEKGMKIELGGIAKGYAADMAVEAIKARGIKAALVAVAGDIKGFGSKPGNRPWNVGVQNPRTPDAKKPDRTKDIIASLHLNGEAVSTSGDYQRFFIKDGKRYHHILDPETGYPAAAGVISVSVIAPDGYMADGLSTGIFILGREKGIKLLESMGLDGIIVDADRKVHITKNLRGKINIEEAD
ncbi:MAG TPA: FAD:protein FMN transferase [Nitrospirae bacterium]|nr:FAD:protein FMN transferase [Nitrospirota bacterium]HDK17310.1 FAD:protein FMN transferase [Nitrospirota bacterium]